MLERIIDASIRHRWAVIAAAGVIAVAGAVSLARLPIDAFPDTTPVQVQVNTDVPALSPEEIEQQITFPIEQALGGLPGLVDLRSVSRFGLSQVTLLFRDDVDLYFARNVVAERLQTVDLPSGAPRPQLGPVATGIGEIVHYKLVGPGKSLQELRTIHDWVVRPQLRSVAGVAEVNTWGGEERQFQVVVEPERLLRYGLSFEDVFTALEESNRNAGGGIVAVGESRLVQGVGALTGTADIEQVVVASRDGVPIRVKDLAAVVDGSAQRRGAVTAEGEGEIVMGLAFMLMGENSHEVAGRIRERLDEVRANLPEGVEIVPLYDRTDLVEKVLHTVRTNLFEGGLLVVAVLFIFLGNLRAGLITALAIPLSLLFAGNFLARFGIAGSLMSLGAIDFGLIVDSSVILVENASRRLAEDGGRRPARAVVRDAAVEVRRPTLFGEAIILMVYLPVLALEGIEGKMFRPMVITVMLAIAGSLLFSMTLMPALMSLWMKPGKARKHEETWIVRAAARVYEPALELALRRRGAVLALTGLALAGGAFLATRLGSEFMPRLSEGSIVINTVHATGITLEETLRYGTRVEQILKERFPDEIAQVWSRTGTAEVATDPMGIELTDVFLDLKPTKEWTRAENQTDLVHRIEEDLIDLPGMRMVFTQPIEMRMNEMVAGIRSDVGIKLFGDDMEQLKTKAQEIADVVSAIDGAADVMAEQITGQPILEVRPRMDAIGRFGVPVERILEVVETIGGREAGFVREDQRRFPLAVVLAEPYRSDPDALARLPVATPVGGSVPLGTIAEVRTLEGPSAITREWGKRRIVVQANARGRDVGSFVADARRAIEEGVDLPSGMYVRWGGQFEHLTRARNRLAVVVPIALLMIFGMLYLTYRRALDAARVFTGVPFAAVGGVVALALRGMPFSVSAAVGFVALAGVAVLDDMILVSFLRQELARGADLLTAVRNAARTRLRPVLMTTLVAALGFLPMALNHGIGAEVQRPLATVVIGGIVSSTLLTLLVLPVLYVTIGARRR